MSKLRSHHARSTRLLCLLSTSALAVGLGPVLAPSASADAPSPVYSYLATGAPPANRLLSFDPSTSGPPTSLAPVSVSPTTYDVSADGSTLALAGTARGADAAASLSVGPTQGLVLVRRAAGATTSRVVATHWSLGPVLSADGATLWWTYRGVVYRWTAGATARLSATLFLPRPGETMTAFAVSPDGTKGAALYWSTTGARLFAADFLKGRAVPYLEQRYPASLGRLATDCFAWLDDATVMFRPAASPTQIRLAPLDLLGNNGSTIGNGTSGWYFPRQVGSQWWVWDRGALPWGPWSYRAIATPLSGGPVPTQSVTTQLNTTFAQHPVLSLTTPPSLGVTADVRAWGTGRLTLSVSNIPYGGRALDIAYGQYLAPLPEESLAASGAKVAGMLQVSYDGTTWRNLRWNGLTIVDPWWGTTTAANGYVTVTRSVWVRYQYRGDPLVVPMLSPVRRLTVTPRVLVTATPSSSGRSRLVAGTVARVGGRALLYRYVGGKYVVIGQTTISSTGRYTFGWRVLPRGSYKVASVADLSWNSGRVFFAI